jgi:hypothetical protein
MKRRGALADPQRLGSFRHRFADATSESAAGPPQIFRHPPFGG